MNLPNKLTVSRIALTCVFLLVVGKSGLAPKVFALLTFMLASLTDYLDGYLAKKHKLVSDFGKIMDPVADKFLMLSAFFVFVDMSIIPIWMFIVIFVREVLITGLRMYAMQKGRILAAENLGKYKTVTQVWAVFFTLVFLVFAETGFSYNWSKSIWNAWQFSIYIFMLIAVGLTLVSGFSFLKNNYGAKDARKT